MKCDEMSCLDKKENTKVTFGSKVMKLDEFDEFVKKDEKLKEKMRVIEEELKQY